ncbi:MAG TPA: hypothetical protein VGP31_02845 [Planosporangium sp.]|nr:hypothetical protein [Planosporangium sp.]
MRPLAGPGWFARSRRGQSEQMYWTFAFIWHPDDVDEDVDRFPPSQPGFHFRPPTRVR